jgi:hypothetical protein
MVSKQPVSASESAQVHFHYPDGPAVLVLPLEYSQVLRSVYLLPRSVWISKDTSRFLPNIVLLFKTRFARVCNQLL